MLPKHQRITSAADFRRIRGRGRRATSPSFLAFTLPNRDQQSRLGVIVSAKIGSSVKRKRASRVLRQAYRMSNQAVQGYDLVLIARPVVLAKTSDEVTQELTRLFSPRPHREQR